MAIKITTGSDDALRDLGLSFGAAEQLRIRAQLMLALEQVTWRPTDHGGNRRPSHEPAGASRGGPG